MITGLYDGWRAELEALGYDLSGTTASGGTLEHEDLLWLIAEAEGGDDRKGRIIRALLDHITIDLSTQIRGLRETVQANSDGWKESQRAGRKAAAERDEARAHVSNLQDQLTAETKRNDADRDAAHVGHQIGMLIDARRKAVRFADLDLPVTWS